MLYRLIGRDKIAVCDDQGVDHQLDPGRDYDDQDPADKKILDRFGGLFHVPNAVEAATAAPGEKRNTRRS